jgi:hypothetical protein
MNERQNVSFRKLTGRQTVELMKELDERLEVFDDGTCRYRDPFDSDARVAAVLGVTPSTVACRRGREFGLLKKRVKQVPEQPELSLDGTGLEARLDRLEHKVDGVLDDIRNVATVMDLAREAMKGTTFAVAQVAPALAGMSERLDAMAATLVHLNEQDKKLVYFLKTLLELSRDIQRIAERIDNLMFPPTGANPLVPYAEDA